jgi:hypothetical protein
MRKNPIGDAPRRYYSTAATEERKKAVPYNHNSKIGNNSVALLWVKTDFPT